KQIKSKITSGSLRIVVTVGRYVTGASSLATGCSAAANKKARTECGQDRSFLPRAWSEQTHY
ncbi:hypothetical protein, partial [Pseudomonas lactis]|uniref:hypothetical protein n=1 Tax=Pseudomonas lactis TaxID=1615674 RepID=UPI001E3177B9